MSSQDPVANLPVVLVVDDEVRSLETITRTLCEEFEVRTATGAAEAQRIMERELVRVVLCDQRMPEITGVKFLSMVRERWPEAVRIIVSGYTDAEDIIEGVNVAGIYQYITKPWHPDQLLMAVRNAVQLYDLQRENQQLALEMKTALPALTKRAARAREQLKDSFHLDRIIRAQNSPLNGACEMVERVAPYDISVLITGESGTGKELFARALHYNSQRADKPFVAENCGALTDQLLESELFGHKKGAFTGAVADHIGLFEQAHGGTIFLDEVGEISPMFQVKLLRVLQEGEMRPVGSQQRRKVDVRIVAATNRDLEAEVRAGRFRQDLYYRLATVNIHLPPLQQRAVDIPLLAQTLLEDAMKSFDKKVRGFTREALECMQRYYWPGNVREMQNDIQRMLVLAEGDLLGADLLSPKVRLGAPPEEERETGMLVGIEGTLKERIEALEARILRETLLRHRWNKSRAAEELGLSRVGLRSKLVRYGLERGDDSEDSNGDLAEASGIH